MKPTVKCPECYSTELYKYGKDKHSNQKYLCKRCKRQFTQKSGKNNIKDYPKYHVFGKGMYLHNKYKSHVSFKCNDKKCNHTIKQLRPRDIADSSSENIFGKNTFSGYRFSINTIITAINLYYALNSTTRAISTYLSDYMNIKISHVTISKWIKRFDKYFKSISDELTQDIYLGDSDEWHADETVVKSYIEAINTTFCDTKHIRVESFSDDISNNLIESFNKTFKSWYKKIKGFKSFESANSLINNFIFYYNFIKSHSSLSNLIPAEVCGINYSHRDKINWFVKY